MATTARATFAAGCFWGVESAFRRVPGVLDARVGYTGGAAERPTYEMVCSGTTGHAEAIEVTYDPEEASYDDLLDTFFEIHDPTQVNRQGPDVGTQYRSAIFPHDPEQEATARAKIGKLDAAGRFGSPIATRVERADDFHAAEEYHQRYEEKNRGRRLFGWG